MVLLSVVSLRRLPASFAAAATATAASLLLVNAPTGRLQLHTEQFYGFMLDIANEMASTISGCFLPLDRNVILAEMR